MGGLRNWEELRAGGTVVPNEAERPVTGGWRTGLRPEVDLSRCVNCLLCWLYCPDSAVELEGTTFTGCEICAEICPVDAVTMVPEEVAP
jgi:2-oxoacid:acceptor oxidoreductase delta subunit (pyruvate/2-ketoisovalerate family)